MFKRLLIATDGEDYLERLGACLPHLRQSGIEMVTFVHAVAWQDDGLGIPPTSLPQVVEMETRLRQAVKMTPPDMEVNIRVVIGKPSDVILQVAAADQADVVLLAMSLQSFLEEKLFGSTTIGLLPRLGIPALIVRPPLIQALTLAELQSRCANLFRFILVPYHFANSSVATLELVVKTIERDPDHSCQSLTLLHIVDTSSRLGQMAANEQLLTCQQKLEQLVTTYHARLPQVNVTSQVRVGSPLTEILRVAAETDVTAIALGSRRPGRLLEWSIPSISGEILRKSWHSLLFFPISSP
ncbi:MAG: universal stress protein [Synechococcales cyanobacterium]